LVEFLSQKGPVVLSPLWQLAQPAPMVLLDNSVQIIGQTEKSPFTHQRGSMTSFHSLFEGPPTHRNLGSKQI
jgi:hypothetical protein